MVSAGLPVAVATPWIDRLRRSLAGGAPADSPAGAALADGGAAGGTIEGRGKRAPGTSGAGAGRGAGGADDERRRPATACRRPGSAASRASTLSAARCSMAALSSCLTCCMISEACAVALVRLHSSLMLQATCQQSVLSGELCMNMAASWVADTNTGRVSRWGPTKPGCTVRPQVLRVRGLAWRGSDAGRVLRAGDLLLAVDGRPVTSFAAVQRIIEAVGVEGAIAQATAASMPQTPVIDPSLQCTEHRVFN